MRRKILAITLASMLVLSSCGSSEQVKKETTDISQTKEEARYESKEMSLPDPLQTANASASDYLGASLENRRYIPVILRWKMTSTMPR